MELSGASESGILPVLGPCYFGPFVLKQFVGYKDFEIFRILELLDCFTYTHPINPGFTYHYTEGLGPSISGLGSGLLYVPHKLTQSPGSLVLATNPITKRHSSQSKKGRMRIWDTQTSHVGCLLGP